MIVQPGCGGGGSVFTLCAPGELYSAYIKGENQVCFVSIESSS